MVIHVKSMEREFHQRNIIDTNFNVDYLLGKHKTYGIFYKRN